MFTLRNNLRKTLSKIEGLTKTKIRSKILNILRKQKEEGRLKKSKIIKERLFKLAVFRKAKRVMFYIAYDGEVKTQEMIREAQKQGKTVAVPVCNRDKREIIPCKIGLKEKFKKGLYGIKKPVRLRPLAKENLDLVVVPGVAFDKRGNRLGRGKGYYDCFLRCLPERIVTVGLAFDFQVLPHLPVTARDVPVDRILFA
jgi:5-formyltetrahydrofolate cyclo-ligase